MVFKQVLHPGFSLQLSELHSAFIGFYLTFVVTYFVLQNYVMGLIVLLAWLAAATSRFERRVIPYVLTTVLSIIVSATVLVALFSPVTTCSQIKDPMNRSLSYIFAPFLIVYSLLTAALAVMQYKAQEANASMPYHFHEDKVEEQPEVEQVVHVQEEEAVAPSSPMLGPTDDKEVSMKCEIVVTEN